MKQGDFFAKKKRRRPLNVSQMIALVFLLIILLGTALLCLPFASRDGKSCGFMTALFTATSSTCVTGLILADTWVQWSGFGQIVIICLIEIGGLGFMSVASSMILIFRKKISMNERSAMAVSVGSDDMDSVVRIQKKAILYSLAAEAAGAAVLTIRFLFDYDFPTSLKLGVFHAISAFCNAGFDIFGFEAPGVSIGLYGTDTVVVLTLSFLIIFGGLGFLVWDEIIRRRSFRRWSIYSKLVIFTSAALLIAGTLFICLSEWNNPSTLGNMTIFEKLKAGFFQSVTSRTAGFAGIDQGALTDSGKAITMFLMLIGGSSGSTAGGLKTVTFVVLLLFLWSRLRGKNEINVFNRRISHKSVLDAVTVFGVMVVLAFAGGIIICCSSSAVSFTDALYEAISAIATVGLTTGITPTLSTIAKLLLVVYMYFGRVGILTISLGFIAGKNKQSSIKYADTDLLVG